MIRLAVLLATLRYSDVDRLPKSPADHRIPYGADPLQFADLRLPKGPGPHPVAVLIHGGCWLSSYNLDHTSAMAAAIAEAGIAVWSIEYRRIGNPGGGWPGTFDDVEAGARHLKSIAKQHNLDLNRVAAIGHSAGGQLALYLAARKTIPLKAAIGLAAITDLARYRALEGNQCGTDFAALMGGSPAEVPERYRAASPIEARPAIPQLIFQGELDKVVPAAFARDYATAIPKAKLTVFPKAGHFELIAPSTAEFAEVLAALRRVLGVR